MLENSTVNQLLVPKKKKKKATTIHGLSKGIFTRLHSIVTFDEDSPELTMESTIFKSYVPRILSSCSTPCRMPRDPLDVGEFNRKIKIPGVKPIYRQTTLPRRLPIGAEKKIRRSSVPIADTVAYDSEICSHRCKTLRCRWS